MVDILLIQPPVRDFYLTAKRTQPYGLARIAGVLLEKGFSVQIFDALATSKTKIIEWPVEMKYLNKYYGRPDRSPFALFHHFRHFGYSFEYIGRIARESGAFLIGISSLFTPYQNEAIRTAETVKKWHPDAKVVMGGHHPTAFRDEMMASPAVDYLIQGEGENALPSLAKALKSGECFKNLPGLVVSRDNKNKKISPPAVQVEISDVPLPAMHLIKKDYYRRGGHGSAVIVASRGCPLRCSYCCLGGDGATRYRRRSVASVINEIEHAVLYHDARFIDFEDENLSLNRQWFLELLSEISRRFGENHLELRAMNGLLPTALDDEIVSAMKTAGFKTLNLSLGSTSKAQLTRFNRPDVRLGFERALNLAEDHELNTVGYIIVGAPEQRAESSLKDLLYLANRRVLAGLSVFYPAPGSADYRLCQTLGLLPDHFALMRSSCLPISHETSRLETVTLLRLARILNFIKALLDNGLSLPPPQPFEETSLNTTERQNTGLTLLGWFLNDGVVRGVTPAGDIYNHLVDHQITTMFLNGIRRITIRGSIQGKSRL